MTNYIFLVIKFLPTTPELALNPPPTRQPLLVYRLPCLFKQPPLTSVSQGGRRTPTLAYLSLACLAFCTERMHVIKTSTSLECIKLAYAS